MLLIIVTIAGTGRVINTYTLDKYSPILDEFERVCKAHTYKGYEHSVVTLWDTDTNLSHGSREVNKPVPPVKPEPTVTAIHAFIRSDCAELLARNEKIKAIKRTREEFAIGLKEAKEHVEKVIAEDLSAKLQSKNINWHNH